GVELPESGAGVVFAADEKHHGASSVGRCREIKHGWIRAIVELAADHILGNADHYGVIEEQSFGRRPRRVLLYVNSLAERILVSPDPVAGGLTDDHYGSFRICLVVAKVSTAANWNIQNSKIFRGNQVVARWSRWLSTLRRNRNRDH